MNHLTADEALCDRLLGILEPVEVRDGNGKVLGVYTPARYSEERALYEQWKSRIDPVELKRRKEAQQGPSCTTAELLARLESLGASE